MVALRCVAEDESVSEHTYAQLRQLTNRFANLLDALGVRSGETVATCSAESRRDRPESRAVLLLLLD